MKKYLLGLFVLVFVCSVGFVGAGAKKVEAYVMNYPGYTPNTKFSGACSFPCGSGQTCSGTIVSYLKPNGLTGYQCSGGAIAVPGGGDVGTGLITSINPVVINITNMTKTTTTFAVKRDGVRLDSTQYDVQSNGTSATITIKDLKPGANKLTINGLDASGKSTTTAAEFLVSALKAVATVPAASAQASISDQAQSGALAQKLISFIDMNKVYAGLNLSVSKSFLGLFKPILDLRTAYRQRSAADSSVLDIDLDLHALQEYISNPIGIDLGGPNGGFHDCHVKGGNPEWIRTNQPCKN